VLAQVKNTILLGVYKVLLWDWCVVEVLQRLFLLGLLRYLRSLRFQLLILACFGS
jgi:hypothetical protein